MHLRSSLRSREHGAVKAFIVHGSWSVTLEITPQTTQIALAYVPITMFEPQKLLEAYLCLRLCLPDSLATQ